MLSIRKPARSSLALRRLALSGILAGALLLFGCSGMHPLNPFQDDASRQSAYRGTLPPHFGDSVKPLQPREELYRMGLYFQKQKEYEVAIRKYNELIRENPEHTRGLNALGVALDQTGRHTRAEEAYRAALELEPDRAHILNNLGYCYLLQGRPHAAVAPLRKAVSLQRNKSVYSNNLATAYLQQGNYHAALRELGGTRERESALKQLRRIMVRERFPREHTLTKKDIYRRKSLKAFRESILQGVPNKRDRRHMLQVLASHERKLKRMRETAVRDHLDRELAREVRHPDPMQVEVSNGNGVRGMARLVATYLQERSFTVDKVTNAENFGFRQSTIFYRRKYYRRARSLAENIPGYTRMVASDSFGWPNIHLKLRLGRDLIAHMETFRSAPEARRLARR